MKSVAGENTDLNFKGEKFHIQTEDWAENGQIIVTRVFKSGLVIKTFRLNYTKIKDVEKLESRRKAVIKLHQFVIDKIYNSEI